MGQGHNRLSRANRSRVVETPSPRALIYLDFRESPAKVRPERLVGALGALVDDGAAFYCDGLDDGGESGPAPGGGSALGA
jgi:hypothetical protein